MILTRSCDQRSKLMMIAALVASGSYAMSAELAWDTAPDPGVQGGNGAWDEVTANWTTDGGATNVTWDNVANSADVAVFSEGTGRVTLDEPINIQGIKISTGATATIGGRGAMTYVLEGAGDLVFGSQQGSIDTFDAGVVSSQVGNNLVGSGGLLLNLGDAPATGQGFLYLVGDNSGLSGGITVANGLLAFADSTHLGTNAVSLQGNAGLFGPVNFAGPGGSAITPATVLEISNDVDVTGMDNLFRVWGGRTLTLNGALTGDGEISRVDGGTLNLNGDASGFSGVLRSEPGQAGSATNLNGLFGGTVEVLTETLNVNETFAGEVVAIAGTTNINADFNGTLSIDGGQVNLNSGTLDNSVLFSFGSLNIAGGAEVTGDVEAEFGADSLVVGGTVGGNLLVDDGVEATLRGASIGGDVTTGFNSSSLITLSQENGPSAIAGDLNIQGELLIATDGTVPFGQDIITFNNLFTDTPTALDHLSVAGIETFRGGQTVITSNSVQATASPESIVWSGDVDGNWDLSTQNWSNGGSPDVFFNGDSVTFLEGGLNSGITVASGLTAGSVLIDSETTNYAFGGAGFAGASLTKQGSSTLGLNLDSGATFPLGFNLEGGTVSVLSNQSLTGTGALALATGTVLNSFPLTATGTSVYANEAISLDGATWNFGGSSPGNVTHTYNFTGGEIGSVSATDPATAIQINDSTINFSSTFTTTKNFNGRIAWSGDNVINRTSSNFTHNTNWGRAWYGDGTITINKTGGATGRAMNFNGAGSDFSGSIILNDTQASGGNDPGFNLNQSIGAASWEVRNRWQLNHNVAGALDQAPAVTLVGSASRLRLNQPLDNSDLTLNVGQGEVIIGDAASTIGSLTGNNGKLIATGDSSALTVSNAAGSVFSGTIDLRTGNEVIVSSSGIEIGEQTVGDLTHESGTVDIVFNASSSEVATIDGDYVGSGGTLRVTVQGVPPIDTPVTVLAFNSFSGVQPTIIVEGLSGDSRVSATPNFGPAGATITFSGAPATVAWSGSVDDTWDVNTTANWQLDGSPSNFFELDTALFDDSAVGNFDVVLDIAVNPGDVEFDNSAQNYTLSGDGAITGASSLTKSGTGVVSIDLENTFSGGTTLNAGRLAVGGSSALGSGAITVNGGAISSIGAAPGLLANAIELNGNLELGDVVDNGDLTLSGLISGAGGISKIGDSTVTLAASADNTFSGGLVIDGGTVLAASSSQVTGTGSLDIGADGAFTSFAITNNSSVTFANSSITVNGGTWNFPGSSGGNVTHTYNFAGGELGDLGASNPNTAIQISDGTLNFASTFTTTKAFNGRINWQGDNVINRTSGNFTHTTNWNGAWYGNGTVTINKTGTATGRAMNFNGAGSDFSGSLVLNNTEASGGNDPTFNLNQSLGGAAIEVRNRWNLVVNAAGILASTTALSVVDAESRLTLAVAVDNASLDLDLGAGAVVNLGGNESTVGSLSVDGVALPAGVYDETESFLSGAGSLTVGDGGATATPYETWLDGFSVVAGSPNSGAFDSLDGSGVANIVQFALGGDPTNPANSGTSIVFDAGDGVVGDPVVLTIAVRAGATFAGTGSPTATVDGVTYVVQGSLDLNSWNQSVEEVSPAFDGAGAATAPAGYELRSFRLSGQAPSETRGFLRVEVAED